MINILISELFIAALALATWIWPYRDNWRMRLWLVEHPLRSAYQAEKTPLALPTLSVSDFVLWPGAREFMLGQQNAAYPPDYQHQEAIAMQNMQAGSQLKTYSSLADQQAWFAKQLVATDIKDGIDNAG